MALIAALAGLVLGNAGPALADDRPWAPDPGQSTPPPGASPTVTPAGATQAALIKAKTTGQPVTVDDLTTQTSLTVANPDGTLTRTNHLQPARVKRNGTWTPVDATLAKSADGTYSPNATPSGVALSGGGTGPLATFTDAAGRSLAMTFPLPLPAPSVTANGAQYPGVLPGVDLKVTVSEQGAFREVLVVRDAAAAANPALKTLRLATGTSGLNVTTDQAGNLTAATPAGTPVFAAATPVMWDSASTHPASGSLTAKATSRAAVQHAAAATAPTTTPPPGSVDGAGVPTSSADGPGQNAHIAPVAVHSDAASLTLTPDAGLLSGTNTTWPLYIDPSVSPVTTGTNHYTEVQEGCPNFSLYDQAQTNGQGIGYQQFDSNCFGLYRSFYEIDTSGLTSSMVISNATLYFTETYGADDGCSNSWPVALTLTGGIGGGTNWYNQPGPSGELPNPVLGTQSVNSSSFNGGCGNHPVNFNVTSAIQKFAGNHPNLTFELSGDEGKYGTNYGFMRFSTNPYLQTVFDLPPNAPSALKTTPDPDPTNPNSAACGSGTAGWIGMAANSSSITLNAELSSPMSGVNLAAGYHVWDNMTNDGTRHPKTVSWPTSASVASGTTVRTNIGFNASDGHTYGWNVWTTDGTLNGPSSPYCYFSVDLTPPTTAVIAPSTAFPPLGSGLAPTAHAGDTKDASNNPITVKVTSTDPGPLAGSCTLAACVSSGVHAFQYSLDQNIPAQGAQTQAATTTNGTASADIPISVSRDQWGAHTLYVRAIDNAGNTQPTVSTYSFYAPWNPGAVVNPGDLTGDGVPDLLATTTDGNLSLIQGNGDAASPVTASTAATSPTPGTGWNKFLIAHRGSISQRSIDDLFAFNTDTKNLYTYRNDSSATGTGLLPGHFTKGQTAQPGRPTCVATSTSNCTGYTLNDWTAVSQILAPGTLSSAAYQAANHITVGQVPDLITVENGKLWYFIGGGDAASYFVNAYPISTGDWSNTTLIAPGTVGSTPTLWARDNTTGAIRSYPLAFDTNGIPISNLTAPARAPLVTGITDTSGKNMCLDIAGAKTANGTPADVWNCNSTNAQKFTLGTDNSAHVLGKCLDVTGAGTAAGTKVQLWDCNNGPSQKWLAGSYPGNLKNPNSGLCLSDPGGNTTPGTQLIIYTCNNAPDQNWAATTTGSTLPTAQSVLPVGIGTGDYPAIASPGDAHGTGNPDLYAISTSGQITAYPGTAPATGGMAQFTAPLTLGYLQQATDRWKLTDTTDSVRPANNLALNGGAAFTSDATRSSALNLNGTTAYAATAGPILDTSTSYTISAWVKLNALGTNASFVSQTGDATSAIANGGHLYYSAGGGWAFGRNDADDSTGSRHTAYAGTAQAGVWTHLVAVQDASTGQLLLYVNGTLAASTSFPSAWAAIGALQIGRRADAGSYGGYANALISDVQAYSTALTPGAVAALQNQPTSTQLS